MFASDMPVALALCGAGASTIDGRASARKAFAHAGSLLYHAYQSHADLTWPLHTAVRSALPDAQAGARPVRRGRRGAEARGCVRAHGARAPDARAPRRFGWNPSSSTGTTVTVSEEIVASTPFAALVHFRKDLPERGPPLLIVAPMSGHFATLLRDTVRTALVDHDVYITDWRNARDVPAIAGRFGLDEYIEHMMQFLRAIGPGAHLLAICQPCVAALAAVALLAEDGDPATPCSMTLMAGPIDCSISPTEVNRLATDKPIEWFEKNLITTVPLRHGGALRRVYPGFVQLMAFMGMNLERHLDAFRGLYKDLVDNETDRANATRAFYEEYFAVCDLPAEFYLETVQRVFQECALARGTLEWRGRHVDLAAIRRTALLTVEGERDDICALGQTLAAHDLCTGLRSYLKTHYVQAGAGHYGVFSGKRWSGSIYPIVRDVIHTSQ